MCVCMARFGCLLLASFASACVALAVQPPTPAAALTDPELLATPAPKNERYFLMLFGSQTTPRTPAYTHTWATVIKVTAVPGCTQPAVEAHTISWLPDSLRVRTWRLRVEPGSNLDLHATLRHVLGTGQRVSAWGPYEIWNGLYIRFLTQKAFLDADAVGYQAIDTVGEAARKGNGCDCFHALSDMDPLFDRRRYPLRYYGDKATFNIVRQVHERPLLICPRQTHDWLIPALGLDCYPIVRRQYEGWYREFSPEALLQVWESGGARRSRSLP
jgi:hypothetical protein